MIYARKGGEEGVLSNANNLGGDKILVEDACVSKELYYQEIIPKIIISETEKCMLGWP